MPIAQESLPASASQNRSKRTWRARSRRDGDARELGGQVGAADQPDDHGQEEVVEQDGLAHQEPDPGVDGPADFIPYPIEKLHKSNHDHIALVAALRAGRVKEAVEVSRKHVDLLQRTMFMGLTARAPMDSSDGI